MSKQRKNRKKKMRMLQYIITSVILICIGIAGYFNSDWIYNPEIQETNGTEISFTLSDIPEFTNKPYVTINNNIPTFTKEDETTKAFEKYSELDSLGRCGVAFSCVGKETMPTEERKAIGSIKPSGWKTAKYDIVEGKYLYNRCHLIGYQLTAENANPKNLITGTRYMNVEGMLPFENEVATYIKETSYHVLYRVTPVYKNNNLVANGVQIEAKSVADKGKGVCFNVYVYNIQPGIEINYANGESRLK